MRREEVDGRSSASCCSSPAGVSPASVSAGAPSSRPQASGEIPMAQAGCQKPPRRKPARGPQHQVKPAASSDLQPESRAGHVAVKAMSAVPQSGGVRAAGLGGVWGAARVQGDERNTRGPSARPGSGHSDSYKPMAKSSRAQRESKGIVVVRRTATKNAVGAKGPCFGRARNDGKCDGLCQRIDKPPRTDTRGAMRLGGFWCTVHASSGRPSVSRVPEIGTHGLKGGPALSPLMNFTV